MKKVLLIAAFLLAASGCTRINPSNTAKQPEIDKNETEDPVQIVDCTSNSEKIRLRASGGKITSTALVFTKTLEELGISDDLNADEVTERINQKLQEQYGNLDGVDAKAKRDGDKVEYTISINYKVADTDELIKHKLLEAEGETSDYVSLKDTKEQYEAHGYACEIQDN